MQTSKSDQKEAVARLHDLVKPGDTVYTTVKHVSRSGMTRDIEVHIIKNNQPVRLTWGVSQALGLTYNRNREAIKVSGCGMDMGFHVVYNLSYELFKGGFECIGENCPSNDHSNGDRNYKSHNHKDGGYALRQAWL